ncbi:hypothetical protein [Mycoplasma struthionis]|uniref:DinB/UmuC family translesion DNA polymerase n=1 Tax=Mycoplasma struthionis TaxID=538220 RepID=UPI003A5C7C02
MSAKIFAKQIQDFILKEFSLPCSIGISYNKFLTKMSTNKAKPFGILETKKEDIEKHFYDLPVSKIFGIGKKNSIKLMDANIKTYRDLVNFDNELLLRKILTKNYYEFIKRLKGEETKDHVFNSETKGIGNSTTFEFGNSSDRTLILNTLYSVILNVSNRAQDQNQEGNYISVLIRETNKNWISKQFKLDHYTNDFEELKKLGFKIFLDLWDEDELIHGLGFRLSNLKKVALNYKQLNLFNESKFENKSSKIISDINNQLGLRVLKNANDLLNEKKQELHNIRFLRKTPGSQSKKINLEAKKWK